MNPAPIGRNGRATARITVAPPLLPGLPGYLTRAMTGRVIVGLLCLTILIGVAEGWNARTSRHRLFVFAPASAGTAPGLDASAYSDVSGAGAAVQPRVDLYGNEVEDAVGDYRIDVRGDLYERHSPDTEVTQLAAPSS
jgi:hypothetical protein